MNILYIMLDIYASHGRMKSDKGRSKVSFQRLAKYPDEENA